MGTRRMKRSEIVKLIEGLLEAGSSWATFNTRADNLLCHLEEKGMLPPSRIKITEDDSINCICNEWEKE